MWDGGRGEVLHEFLNLSRWANMLTYIYMPSTLVSHDPVIRPATSNHQLPTLLVALPPEPRNGS